MTNSYAYSATRKYFVISLAIALLTMLLTVVSTSPAFAACNGGQSDFGCEDGQGGGGGDGGNGTQPPATPGPSNPGTGNPGPPADPYLTVVRHVPAQGACPVDDGRNALGLDIFYTTIFEMTSSKDVAPTSGGVWIFQGIYPGHGAQWAKKIEVGRDCLYPAKTYITTSICYISTTATVQMTAPRNETLATNTEVSGFGQGSTDYDACMDSKSSASVGLHIKEYGFFIADMSSLAQIATIEVAFTPNELTEITPKPVILGLSPVFTTAAADVTASNHCTTDFISPGIMMADFTNTSGCEKTPSNPNGIFQCNSEDVPRVHGYDAQDRLQGYDARERVQILGDGNPNKVTFNQSVTGEGLNIENHSTQFALSEDSVPFSMESSTGFIDPNELLTEVYTSDNLSTHQNIMRTNRHTNMLTGKIDEIYLLSFTESAMYTIQSGLQALKFSQLLNWSGTITQNSVNITRLEPGVIITEPITVQEEISGVCSDTAVIEAIRAHPDTIG